MRRLAIAIAALLAVSTIPAGRDAQAAPSPTVVIDDARAYRNIIQAGDVFLLIRYELPQQTTPIPTPVAAPEAWCLYLTNPAGCTGTTADPVEPTALQTNIALLSLYSSCNATCSTGTLEKQDQPPRIHNALGGLYFDPGNALLWDNASARACVESAATFSPVGRSCRAVLWNTASSAQATQRTQLGNDLRVMLRDLEKERGEGRNVYVANNLITSAGRVLALEALSVLDRIIPSYFQAASVKNETGFATPAAVTSLQARIDATAAASGWTAAADGTASTLAGISGGAFFTVLFAILGFVVAWWMYKATSGSIVMAVLAFGMVAMVGIFIRGPSVAAIAVASFVMAVPALFFLGRKIIT